MKGLTAKQQRVLNVIRHAMRHRGQPPTVREIGKEIGVQSSCTVQRHLDAFIRHDTTDRLPQIAVPTLVLAGGRDSTSRPELCRAVAALIPDARFEVMKHECHQALQEVPDDWNARVHAFWSDVEADN